jgi:hypothetical protein
VLNYVGIKEKGGCIIVVKKKSVSSKTHTQKQLDDYANQNNPNNKAYHAHNEDGKINVLDLVRLKKILVNAA